MKNLNKYHIYTIGLFFLFACEDQLNVEPTLSISDEAALTSEENVKKLLIGTYEIDGSRNSHGGYIHMFSDLLGSDEQVSWNGTFTEPREALTKTMFANNFLINAIWNNLYKVISQTNLVLDHLALISDDGERSRIEGEARFLRALNYFELLRLFGNETKGVPLRLQSISDYGGDLKISRSSTVDVYSAIQDDIVKAVSLLPEANEFYADKYAALALQARVNLYVGKYTEARDAAHLVISASNKVLSSSFADAFNHDENGVEDIYAMQVTSQSGENQLIQMYASEENGGRGGDISINQSYLDLFDDPNDERAHFLYENGKGDFLTGKYTNQFGNIPIFRLAEMILIRAECNTRLNTTIGNSPLDDVNSLRQRSGAAALTSISIQDILLERQRELAFEGFAIYDIKRTKSTIAGLPYNSPKLVMPIPQAEIDANALMEQNEGY
ncbi:MAG: RagB/SusD family nutrient uptake outer membrane protein [Saprospiraceae bacterium]|nr:RagB/SusD family nutrient uptake outer membrane protein [Saprospiraceae bacterium]